MGRVPTWVSYEQLRIMGVLYYSHGSEYRGLSDAAGVYHGAVHTVLGRLEQRGLCERDRAKRPSLFTLTPFGEGLVELLLIYDSKLLKPKYRLP